MGYAYIITIATSATKMVSAQIVSYEVHLFWLELAVTTS